MDSQAKAFGSFFGGKTKKSTHFWADFWRYMKKKKFWYAVSIAFVT